MPKLIRTDTFSYTAQTHTDPWTLGRGLWDLEAEKPFKTPDELADYLRKERKLVLRQVISGLDKTLQKRKSLKHMSTDAYLHRVFLGNALWDRLGPFLENGAGAEEMKAHKRKWIAKVHPYRKHKVDTQNPTTDGNFDYLRKREKTHDKPPFSEFLTKWQVAFWPEDGSPDYDDIAKKIWNHVSDQEVTIKKGEPRLKRKGRVKHAPETGKGLMEARGAAISTSASDPRTKSKKLRRTWGPIEIDSENSTSDAEIRYFRDSDVAADIHRHILETVERGDRVFNGTFGEKTHKHFGPIINDNNVHADDALRQNLWNLHNSIRGYYKTLATSQRFRRALRENRIARENPEYDPKKDPSILKLKIMLPDDRNALMRRLKAGQENASMSEAIRLGKILVHAALKTDQHNCDEAALNTHMNYFVTSPGLGEIKRTESFARVWRQSAAVATRTLTGLTNYEGDDINLVNHSRNACSTHDLEHVRNQIPLIFGAKAFGEGGSSRSSLFLSDDDKEQREILWTLIRLGGEIRDDVQHFNVRDRLLSKITSQLLEPVGAQEIPDITKRSRSKGTHRNISETSHDKMSKLLMFDRAMRKEAVRQQLEAIKAHEFLDPGDLGTIIAELGSLGEFKGVTPPRFFSIMRLVQGFAESQEITLHEDFATISKIKKLTSGEKPTDDNDCRKGLLQMLYRTGFQVWCGEKAVDATLSREVIDLVIAEKNDRIDEYQRTVNGKTIPTVSEMVEDMELDRYETIADLLNALAQHAMKETDQDLRYSADALVQSATANRIERFKQEIFAHLFGRYLKDKGLLFIGDISDAQETVLSVLDEAMDSFKDELIAEDKDWYAFFYTWLYLVPPPEISKLRHQMKKSIALEEKSPTQTDEATVETLAQMDRLMALYVQVQAAGFSGVEHRDRLKDAKYLYEKATDPDRQSEQSNFNIVFSDADEDKEASIAGTRRGLRQMLRFSDLSALESVFKAHPISNQEVATFTTEDSPNVKTMFGNFEKLRKGIIEATKIDAATKDEQEKALLGNLPTMVTKYQTDVLNIRRHDFHANAARLTDHVKLHQMLMAVVAKLTDYALFWERDKIYAYVGMLYRHLDYTGVTPKWNGQSLAFRVRGRDGEGNPVAFDLKLADEEKGFTDELTRDEDFEHLPEGDRELFKRAFVKIEGQSKADQAAAERARANKDKVREFANGPNNSSNRKTIRNDLAHLSVLRPERGVQLTYLINAVRSLMSYDQKQKNAVVKSVKRILGDYGLTVQWRMREDRLSQPIVYPLAEQHLKMVKGPEYRDLNVLIPRASVRLTSMGQALFDFGSSGHCENVKTGTIVNATLDYPLHYYSKSGTPQYVASSNGASGDAAAPPKSLNEAVLLKFSYEKPAR